MATKTKELTQTENIKTTDEMVIWDGVHTLRTPSVALAQVLNAGNLKMPDSEETIAEHYRQFCNRNLLINWYFFKPVNQQGLTAYQVRGYTIDMWRTWTATTRVSLSKEGVLVDCTNADADGIYQYFEDGESLLVGKIVTISVLTKEYGLINKSGILTSGSSSIIQTTEFGDIALFHSLAKTPLFFFRISVNAGKAVTVIAAKLEFGSSQTLAHREGSKWVLNEIPDYALELLKCQRYQFTSGGRESIYNLAIGTATSNKIVDFFLPLPTIMRTKAAVSFSNLYVSNSTIHHKVSRIENYGNVANGVWLHVTTEDSNLTTGQAYYLRTANPFSFILDANL